MLDGPAIEKGAVFERKYPDSALRLPVCEMMARAWRAKGDAARATASVSAGLAIAPDYIPLLVELADLAANDSSSGSGWERAENAAVRALTLLESAKAPRRVTAEAWTTAVAALRARAHSALGLVRFKRDDLSGAAKEFEAALAERSSEGPAIHYRLGRLYALAGREADARSHLREAAKSGEPALRDRAAAALTELENKK